jgi:hypothetical protein
VTLGAPPAFDAAWGGRVHGPLAEAAARLSAELGHRPSARD